MSNYKNLVPIGLIVFGFLGCYTRLDDSAAKQRQYDQYLEDARTYREGKIYVDSFASYKSALEMKNTLNICEEVGDMLLESNKASDIESWGKYMVDTYPKNVEGYEYLIDYYMAHKNYQNCFSYYDITEKRNLHSDTLTAKINSILYEYDLGLGRYDEIEEYSNGYAVVINEGKYGYVDHSGNYNIEPTYQYAGAFGRDFGPIQDESGEWYYVDNEGNRRMNYPDDLELEVTKLGYIGNGQYAVGNESTVYFANTDGEIVSGPYQDAGAYNEQRAVVKKVDKWYLADLQGNILSDGYEQFAMDVQRNSYRNGVAFAQIQEKYVMLNGDGKTVTTQKYQDAKCFLDDTYAAVEINGLWGFVDNQGKVVIEPVYEDALSFSNGFAAVKKDGLWGYINLEGKMVISPVFEDAHSMNANRLCFVKEESSDKWAVLRLIRYQ